VPLTKGSPGRPSCTVWRRWRKKLLLKIRCLFDRQLGSELRLRPTTYKFMKGSNVNRIDSCHLNNAGNSSVTPMWRGCSILISRFLQEYCKKSLVEIVSFVEWNPFEERNCGLETPPFLFSFIHSRSLATCDTILIHFLKSSPNCERLLLTTSIYTTCISFLGTESNCV
jgi:hypothetical protein